MAGSLHSAAIHRPGKRGLLPRTVSPKAIPRYQQRSRDSRGSHGPCVGQTLDLPVIFPEPDGLLTEGRGTIEIK